eukprot:CAMPEP_0170458524 /NCGR_PEP_ID=MMETSP0123-20130129/5465_1 /TAXON_ID=182087 /ORGANISM="Favella ehrenbergii, Strain Fehren 1" /LENGTH=66 /DNA_ID=CAMNT_0010722701 /DNA_START=975 /DNA_END=1175 /DNA_ORIENTATION=+
MTVDSSDAESDSSSDDDPLKPVTGKKFEQAMTMFTASSPFDKKLAQGVLYRRGKVPLSPDKSYEQS